MEPSSPVPDPGLHIPKFRISGFQKRKPKTRPGPKLISGLPHAGNWDYMNQWISNYYQMKIYKVIMDLQKTLANWQNAQPKP